MFTTSNSKDYLLLERQLQPLSLQVKIVSKGQDIYTQGRDLVNQMYVKAWGSDIINETLSFVDDNHYGIVVTRSGQTLGNVNLQIKHNESHLLQSEVFFTEQHWHQYLSIPDGRLAEISGFCVSDTIPQFLSRPVMMGLVLGLQLLHNSLQVRYFTAIQHEYLIRILQKSLNLPFFCNEIITAPKDPVPNNGYWKRNKLPKIYYLDGYSTDCIKACASFFCYLSLAGYDTHFVVEKPVIDISYASLWRFWN